MTTPSETDQELLQRYVAGDRDALGDLACRYERPMLGMALGMLRGDRSAACDAVQSMWVRVIRYAHTFKGNSSVKTWLYAILLNECRAMLGRRVAPATGPGEPGEVPAPGPDDELHQALARLDDVKREVLLVCYHEGMTHALAADVLGIPVGTLKSRLHGALEELRSIMGLREGEVAV